MRIGIIGSTGLKIDLFADRSQFETMAVGENPFGTIMDMQAIMKSS